MSFLNTRIHPEDLNLHVGSENAPHKRAEEMSHGEGGGHHCSVSRKAAALAEREQTLKAAGQVHMQ